MLINLVEEQVFQYDLLQGEALLELTSLGVLIISISLLNLTTKLGILRIVPDKKKPARLTPVGRVSQSKAQRNTKEKTTFN
jgi:hypothetical protein